MANLIARKVPSRFFGLLSLLGWVNLTPSTNFANVERLYTKLGEQVDAKDLLAEITPDIAMTMK